MACFIVGSDIFGSHPRNDGAGLQGDGHVPSRPDHLWPELWKSMGEHAKLKEKQKWSDEKFHLDKRTKIERDLFHRPRGHGTQRNHQERA